MPFLAVGAGAEGTAAAGFPYSEFQDRFRILEVDYRDDGYVEWVFKRNDACIRDFPEDTLLQRNMKRYLLAGGKIGSGFGVVKIAEGKQA